MRLVVISNDIPYPPTSGGRVDVWRRLCALKDAGVEVALVCWFDIGRTEQPGDAELDAILKVCDWVEVRPIRRTPSEIARRLLRLWREPSHVAARRVTTPLPRLLSRVAAYRPDAVLLDGLYGGAVAEEVALKLRLPLLYRSHNVEHRYMALQLQRQPSLVRKLGLLANIVGLRKYEMRIMTSATVVFDISIADKEFWEAHGMTHVEWVPPIVDGGYAARVGIKVESDLDVLYFGNLNTPNNVEGLTWFVREVLPLLPDESLRIGLAGSKPNPEVRSLVQRDQRTRLIENPVDMAAVVRTAKVLVNPVRAGSGVNLKATEMIFSNAQLVSTSAGVAGLPEAAKHCFAIKDDAPGFAAAILAALGRTAQDVVPARLHARSLFGPLLFSQKVISRISANV